MENRIWTIYKEVNKLKNLVRSGWIQRGVPLERLESVAEHIFSMAFLALTIIVEEDLKLDMAKVMQLVLVHEIGEIDAGDFTPYDNVPSNIKYDLELSGVKRIDSLYSKPVLLDLWKEFEDCITPEARFVKKLDKLEAVMQAKIYSEKTNDDLALFNEFFNNALNKIDEYQIIFEQY